MKKLWKWLAISAIAAGMTFSVGGLTACDENPGDPPPGPQEPAAPIKLASPSISRNGNVVTWAAVPNAITYKYKINGGAERTAEGRSVVLEAGQEISVKAVGDAIEYLDSDWSSTVRYNPTKLLAPVVTLDGNVATWAAVANASGYKYKIDNGTEQTATGNSVTLQDGESIVVKAIGDGEGGDYLDSDWSAERTYVAPVAPTPDPVQLGAPVVTLDDNVATWVAVANASGYKYKIDNGTEQITTALSVTLQGGESIVVKAIGDGENYTDSIWSNAVTYEAPAPDPVQLGTPVVTLDDNVATWVAVANASGYKYKIDNGTEQITTALSVTLQGGESIVVKAIGDGENYTDSIWSTAVTYEAPVEPADPVQLGAPVLTRNGNTVSWQSVANASGYKYKIDGGAEQTATGNSVTLQEGESIVVKAVGDGENYTDSDWSQVVVYTIEVLEMPVVTLDGNVASWTANANATEYKYKIDGGVEQSTTSTSAALVDGQTIVVKAIGDGVNYKNSDWSVAVTFEAQALATPVLSREGNQVKWAAVPNATAYKYKIDGGVEQTTTDRFVVLEDGQSIVVKGVTTDAAYKDSEYSATFTYQLEKLEAPQVSTSGSKAVWQAVANAVAYKYKINGGTEQTTYELFVTLEVGQNVVVKAVGDNLDYKDGDWSAAVTYASTYLVNGCEDISTITGGDDVTVAMDSSHATQGASSIKATTSAAWSRVNIQLLKDGKPLTQDDLENCLYIEFDVYAETAGTILFYFNQQLPTLVAGANTLRISGRDILYQTQENAVAYDFDTGMAYFQVFQAGQTVYFDNFVMHTGTRPALECGSMEATADMLNDCEVVEGWVEAGTTPVLSTSNAYQGTYSVEATGAADGWWLNVRIGGDPTLETLKATYDKIRLNVYSSYPNLEDGSAANSLWLGNATVEDFASRVVAILRQGTNVVEIPTSMLDETMYVEAYGSRYLSFRVGGACTIRIDNVVGLKGAVKLGNVFILGDSYSTFEEYIAYNSAAAWYTEVPRNTNGATVGEAQTDVTSATQTWWGQLLASTNSNLLTNASYSGTTVCNRTYSKLDGSATAFTTRLQKFIDEGYFTQNRVDTFFLFGGTNDAWAYAENIGNGMADYIGTPKYANWTEEDMFQVLPAYAYMINQIKTNVPTARLVVLLNKSWTEAKIVEGYKEICDHYGVEYIEVVLSSSEVQQLHPNKAGMTAIKDQIIAHLG